MKRKILTMVVIFVISLSTLVVADTTLDLSSMTLDELVALKNEINSEIRARIGDEELFTPGIYVVGKDIKAGSYNLANLNQESEGLYTTAYVKVYKEGDDPNSRDSEPIVDGAMAAKGTYTVNLEEGTTLKISMERGELSISPVEGASWRP